MTIRKTLALISTTLIVLACATLFPSSPTPTPAPTLTSSGTPEPALSPTPSPSTTPAIAPSLTPLPTFAYEVTLWPTPTVPGPLDCRLVWQSPGNFVKYHPRDYFSVGWKVMNTGTVAWSPGKVELAYVGGAKLYLAPTVQLKTPVPRGQAVIWTAEMRAPVKLDRYTTYWSLRQGTTYFCRLALTISVEE
jgi:Ig-like domain from next to BRCA1 gene